MAASFHVQALASGSSGNATLVRAGATAVLIDAGLSIRRLVAGLDGFGVTPGALSGIVVTHEHSDHAQSAAALSQRFGVPLVASRGTLGRIYARAAEGRHFALAAGEPWHAGDLVFTTFPVPHDAAEPVGVNVVHTPTRAKASYATDLGHVSTTVREQVRGADLLILEANHDVHRLRSGRYPPMLQNRILSDAGHLSNEAAVALICEHAGRKGPFTAWLAHLSAENNTPKLALGYARATVRLSAGYPVVIDVARRDRPSASWSPGCANVQLTLF
jgi:phosphoribosyl 1,2-cyclic phosphodiesterase